MVATPHQLKLELAPRRNFKETVDQPDKLDKIVTCYNADEKPLGNIALHIKGKSKAMPGFAATLPRRSRERGAKAYLRRERPISKPSSNVESHPKDCSAGNQKISQNIEQMKATRQGKGRYAGSRRDNEEKI